MHLLLISGFLGSGKTTLIIRLAQVAGRNGSRVAVVVNEIGEIGIDDQVMRQVGLNVWELLGGCICCTLSGDLVKTLESLDADYAPDLAIVEASGAANPRTVLSALPYYRGRPLDSMRTLTVVDPLRLRMLLETLTPLVTSQIEQADIVVVSKTDQASTEETEAARQAVVDINPRVRIRCLSAKSEPEATFLTEVLPWLN
ncbi:MAG: CobW family GTP-binding protein [Chloroflexota bacterium]